MEQISTVAVSISPSFSMHSSNNLADIADRVVEELRNDNGFNDDIFDFRDDDDNNPEDTEVTDDYEEEEIINSIIHTEKVKENEKENGKENEEEEFEFPVICRDFNLSVDLSDEIHSVDGQISPRYPLFDRSLLLDDDFNSSNETPGSTTGTISNSKPARLSLMKLFNEDRESVSSSSSEADDLDGITPGTYCVWNPKTEQRRRGNHKKSNSISIGTTTSKRWKVRDLLKRSYSDDNYSAGKDTPVFLFSPSIVPKQKTNNEKAKKVEKTSKVASPVRLPPYLPYRQDQIGGAYAKFNGSSKNLYRY